MDKDIQKQLGIFFHKEVIGKELKKYIQSLIEREKDWLVKDLSESETYSRRGKVKAFGKILTDIDGWIKTATTQKVENPNPMEDLMG